MSIEKKNESNEDIKKKILLKYDKNGDGILSENEIKILIEEYKNKSTDEEILKILSNYDRDKDGNLDTHEVETMTHELTINDSNVRYFGYSLGLARLFRYLAFTSDFGEAFRPIVSARIVTGSYAVAISYCFADVAWESYKLHKRNYMTEPTEKHPSKYMSLSQCIVERSAFQAIASMAVPTLIIHTTVDVSKKIFKRIGRFQKWGPSIMGLSVIPLLPLYLDHPVESALEWTFENYGPWAEKKSHKD